jgi:hypothetical protein
MRGLLLSPTDYAESSAPAKAASHAKPARPPRERHF